MTYKDSLINFNGHHVIASQGKSRHIVLRNNYYKARSMFIVYEVEVTASFNGVSKVVHSKHCSKTNNEITLLTLFIYEYKRIK